MIFAIVLALAVPVMARCAPATQMESFYDCVLPPTLAVYHDAVFASGHMATDVYSLMQFLGIFAGGVVGGWGLGMAGEQGVFLSPCRRRIAPRPAKLERKTRGTIAGTGLFAKIIK